MITKTRLLRLGPVGLVLALAQVGWATKPCGPQTWYAKGDRPAAEWSQLAQWVAVGKVTERKEIIEPFANCALKDRSQCAMQDRSIVFVRVERWEKGRGAKRLKLSAAYCGPTPPKGTGKTFRFYGVGNAYLYFEPFVRPR